MELCFRSVRQEQMFSSRKLKLTSFVTSNNQTWQSRRNGDRFTMETREILDVAADNDVEDEDETAELDMGEVLSSTGNPEDIITIEDSISDNESVNSDPTSRNNSILSESSSSKRGRRKSRLAANFSSNE